MISRTPAQTTVANSSSYIMANIISLIKRVVVRIVMKAVAYGQIAGRKPHNTLSSEQIPNK